MIKSAYAQTTKIVVTVNGIENSKGKIEIGLYNNKADFPSYSKAFRGVSLKASPEGVKYTFTDIPKGNYAIAAWQDVNEDKKLNKNFLGIPTEKFGFSLNKFGMFGPPSFDVVAFKTFPEKETTLEITLK